MKSIFLSFLLFQFVFSSFAQIEEDSTILFQRGNSFQLDAGGPGGFYSINYERIFVNKDRYKFAAQLGMAIGEGVLFNLSLNNLISFRKHHVEIGISSSLSLPYKSNNPQVFLVPKVGYRIQKPKGRWLFKAMFNPWISFSGSKPFFPWGGLTLGYTFGKNSSKFIRVQ
jgi:hypothetical protein